MVDAQALAKAQQTCPNTAAHRAGKCLPDIQMRDVEYASVIVLYCDISTGKSRPLVPLPMQNLVMGAFHSLVHPGQKGTLQKVNARYYWPNLPTDVSEYVKTCNPCQQVKKGRTIAPPVKNKPVLPQRFSDLEIDVVGPLPKLEGMRYLLTILDRTTRCIKAILMAQQTSLNCSTAFARHWVKNFGIPKRATSDNGSTFVTKLWKDLHEKLGTIVSYTPPFYSASLGGVERQHRE